LGYRTPPRRVQKKQVSLRPRLYYRNMKEACK
jgi:hypothetical protein